jgi:hypothetical protein
MVSSAKGSNADDAFTNQPVIVRRLYHSKGLSKETSPEEAGRRRSGLGGGASACDVKPEGLSRKAGPIQ